MADSESTPVEVRACSKCGIEKPLAAFDLEPDPPRGMRLRRQCSLCRRARQQVAKRRKYQEDSIWQGQRRALREAGSPSHQLRNSARAAARDAVRTGRLVRPERCSQCGAGGRIQGHHDDYAKPLDVRWLCQECHGKAHRKLGPDWVVATGGEYVKAMHFVSAPGSQAFCGIERGRIDGQYVGEWSGVTCGRCLRVRRQAEKKRANAAKVRNVCRWCRCAVHLQASSWKHSRCLYTSLPTCGKRLTAADVIAVNAPETRGTP